MYSKEIDEKHLETNKFYHFAKYKPNLAIDFNVAKDMIRERKTISGNIARPFFIDITELLSVDSAARNYMASSDACEFINAGTMYSK